MKSPLYDAGLKEGPGDSPRIRGDVRHPVEKYIYIDKKHSMI
jgi:hypothetical protein